MGGIVLNKFLGVLKILVISYVVTGVLLLLLSLCMLKMNISSGIVTVGIVVIYIISTFGGGFLLAKREKTRRLMWGALFGVIYFLVLFVMSVIINKGISMDYAACIRGFFVCLAAGAVGGFLS